MSERTAQLADGTDLRHTSSRSFVFMKRFSALAVSAFVLAACNQSALPSEEVFSRAMTAIRGFTSSDFVLHARAEENGTEQWKADATGRMASGGKQLQFDIKLDMGPRTSFDGSVLIPAENEVYLKVAGISMGDFAPPMPDSLSGTWWKLPAGSGALTAVPVTPDPSFLTMQMETLKITKEHGIERINQRRAYKYDVTMDEARLFTYLQTVEQDRGGEFQRQEWQSYLDSHDFTGTLWIDAESFLPDRIQWTVTSSPAANPRTGLSLDVTFANQNETISIVPPATSSPFPMTANALQNMLLPPAATTLP